MKIRFLQLSNWLLAGLMGIFGLQACHSQKKLAESENKKVEDNYKSPPEAMYGGPEIDYQSGKDSGNVMPPRMYGGPVQDYNRQQNQSKTPPKTEPREPQVTVYGVPTVNYSVKGKVVDSQGRPIKGLKVVMVSGDIDPNNLPDNGYWQERLKEMSDTTDAKGTFEVHATDRPGEQQRVLVVDVDGKKNGSFKPQLVDVEFKDDDKAPESSSRWMMGAMKGEVTVKMKRK